MEHSVIADLSELGPAGAGSNRGWLGAVHADVGPIGARIPLAGALAARLVQVRIESIGADVPGGGAGVGAGGGAGSTKDTNSTDCNSEKGPHLP